MKVENILAIPSFREKEAVLLAMSSEELTKLYEDVDNYITANGNNYTLQWLLDKTFNIGYINGKREKELGI
jgi:hypothetical protein|nr:MAG TPA: hypothetical protein [Caudoviricetes sp.]